ncbi:hypothetical protein AAFC00_004136 [Neodothiora populina]
MPHKRRALLCANVVSSQWLHSLPKHTCRSYYNVRKLPPSAPSAGPPLDEQEHNVDIDRPSRALPTSPYLDPRVTEQKLSAAYKYAKPRQDPSDQTEFQRRLARNPYAQALSTAVRHCSYSQTRLPQHFLLPFATAFETREEAGKITKLAPTITLLGKEKKPACKTHLLGSRAILRRMSRKKTWQRLISREMHERFNVKAKGEWRWPEDIEDIVLQHLRSDVVAKLRWAFDMANANLVMPVDAAKLASGEHACTLRLAASASSSSNADASDTTPLFDLPVLLGDEFLTKLIQGTRFAENDCVVVADSHLTVSARMRLLRLQDFLDDETKWTS